MHSKKT
jgi:hypothetical protein